MHKHGAVHSQKAKQQEYDLTPTTLMCDSMLLSSHKNDESSLVTIIFSGKDPKFINDFLILLVKMLDCLKVSC